MKRILIDVDGVIADLMPSWLSAYNAEWDDQLQVQDITDWDMTKFVKPECGDGIFTYLSNMHLYDDVLPIDGAVSSVRWLRRHGYDVRFVTSGVYESKILWLAEQGLLLSEHSLSSPDVVVTHDKSIIKADIMIDDNLKNLRDFGGIGILFAQPWNNSNDNYYFRAECWSDVIQYLVQREAGSV